MERYSLIVNDHGNERLYASSDSMRMLERSAEHWLNGYAYADRECTARIIDNETGEVVS